MRQQLLAGAAFAENQHRYIGRRHLLDHAAHFEHRLIGCDYSGKRRARLALQLAVLLLKLVDAKRARHDQLQDLRLNGLLTEVRGAESHGPHGARLITIAGHDNDLDLRGDLQNLLQRAQALGDACRIRRQTQVLQYHRGLKTSQVRDGFLACLHDPHAVLVEAPLELLLQPGVVFDYQ